MESQEVDRGVRIYRRAAGGSWWLDATADGKRTQRSLKTTDRRRALTIARELAGSIVSRTWNISAAADLTVERAIADYRPARGGLNARTLANIRRILTMFRTWLDTRGVALLDRVSRGHVEDYRGGLAKSLAPATVNTHVSRIGSLLKWAKDSGFLRVKVTEGLRTLPSMKRVKRVLSADEIRKLIEHLNPTLADLVLVLANVPLRISEALSLTAGDVELGRGLVKITSTKVYQEREVMLNAAVRDVLARRRLASGGGLIFPSAAGTPLSRDNVRRAFILAATKAGITKPREVTPHAFRRSAATALLALGVPLPVVVQLGGWKDARVLTAHYVGRINAVPPVVVAAGGGR